MAVSKNARRFIELALREKIEKERPGFAFAERVVKASMNGLNVNKDVLYRAIDLAYQSAQQGVAAELLSPQAKQPIVPPPPEANITKIYKPQSAKLKR